MGQEVSSQHRACSLQQGSQYPQSFQGSQRCDTAVRFAGQLSRQCFALSLLQAVADLSSERSVHESGCQTEEGPGSGQLGWQLARLESAYLKQAEGERQRPLDGLEARMARYRQECDKRVKEEVARQVSA